MIKKAGTASPGALASWALLPASRGNGRKADSRIVTGGAVQEDALFNGGVESFLLQRPVSSPNSLLAYK